MKNRCNLWD